MTEFPTESDPIAESTDIPEDSLLEDVQRDPRYQRNLDWGRPRPGHPEGTVRAHIEELERNLEEFGDRLSPRQRARVRLLVHVHDTFKPDGKPGVAIEDPRSHASLARAFLAEFADDEGLLAMVQWHDVPYAIWRKFHHSGRLDENRLTRLVAAIDDWATFAPFLVVDNRTEGKRSEPLDWFLDLLANRDEYADLVRAVT